MFTEKLTINRKNPAQLAQIYINFSQIIVKAVSGLIRSKIATGMSLIVY